ncbi:MAG: hypothetical protein OXM54_14275, partial [Acidimicrobiaceae bacterium]|nr:hypothetical protein [Acidimicrobiaceae bacterium]
LTVATADDSADEPDGTVTATLVDEADYDLGASKTATIAVSDNDDPPPPPDGTCVDKPTLSIGNPTAMRTDSTVAFTVSLDCKPARSVPVLLAPVRDGNLGSNIRVVFTGQLQTITVPVTIGSGNQLSLALVWAPGVVNRAAQGTVIFQ